MNILITGCAGFIGSHATDFFLSKNYNVVGVDALTYAGKIENLSKAMKSNNFVFFKDNICNTENIEKYCEDYNVEWIINFAAETHVDNSIKCSSNFVSTNVEGVRSLLDVCVRRRIKIMQISTDEVYGSIEKGSFFESSKLNPRNPYSATKAAAEHLVTAYNNTFEVPYLIVRMSNNFGPRQHCEKLIPTILNCLNKNKKIPIYGNGENVRDWFYVKDCVKFLEKILCDKRSFNEIYNITNSLEMKNLDIIEKICKLKKKDMSESIEFIADRKGHDRRYSISNEKFFKNFQNFKSKTPIEEALKETILFYDMTPNQEKCS